MALENPHFYVCPKDVVNDRAAIVRESVCDGWIGIRCFMDLVMRKYLE